MPPAAPPRPFRFFLSYSSQNLNDQGLLAKFYEDLSASVRDRVGGADDVAFRDRVTIKLGTEWPAALLHALKTSQVLVCLISADYLLSEYCRKELSVFLQRIDRFKREEVQKAESEWTRANPGQPFRSRPPTAPFILPVPWIPSEERLPQALADYQQDDSTFPAQYRARGMLSIAKQSDRDPYNAVIEALSKRIVEVSRGAPLPSADWVNTMDDVDAEPVEPPPPPSPSTGRRSPEVHLVYVAPSETEARRLVIAEGGTSRPRANIDSYGTTGWHWKPYHPPLDQIVSDILQDRLRNLRPRLRPLEYVYGEHTEDDQLLSRLSNEIEKNSNMVVLVVDVWALYLARYKSFLAEFDRRVRRYHGIFVPWNDEDPDTKDLHEVLETRVKDLFANNYPGSSFFHWRVANVQELDDKLCKMIETLRAVVEQRRAAERRIIQPTRPAPLIGITPNFPVPPSPADAE